MYVRWEHYKIDDFPIVVNGWDRLASRQARNTPGNSLTLSDDGSIMSTQAGDNVIVTELVDRCQSTEAIFRLSLTKDGFSGPTSYSLSSIKRYRDRLVLDQDLVS